MKRIVPIALALSLALSISPALAASQDTTIQAAYRDVTIVADGVPIVPRDASGAPVEPFLYNGTTYLPVRAVADALGVGVAWDQATYTVRLTSGAARTAPAGSAMTTHRDKSIGISYRDVKLEVDGKLITPRDANGNVVEPFLYGGTTYLPVRAVADAMGVDVSWDQETYTVYLGQKAMWVISHSYTKDADGKLSGESFFTHDDKGQMTHRYSKDADGKVTGEALWTYDDRGQLTRECEKDADGKVTSETVHTYDDKGQLRWTSELSHNIHGDPYTFTYTYDERGQLIKETSQDSRGSKVIIYTYDAAGHETSRAESFDGSSQWDVYEQHWDDAGRLVLDRTLLKEGSQEYEYTRTTYTYDDAKNQMFARYTSSASRGYIEWTYTYDQYGNCVKEIMDVCDAGGNYWTESYERSFTATGEPLSEIYTTRYNTVITKTWSYSFDGKLIQYRTVSPTVGGGTSEVIYNYAYDQEGRLSKETHLENGLVYYSESYDQEGRLVNETQLKNGKIEVSTTRTYDLGNNTIRWDKTIDDTSRSEFYEYDQYGNEIKSWSSDSSSVSYYEYQLIPLK